VRGPLRRLLVLPFILLLRCYQVAVSPLLPAACRFTPTCSEYCAEALREWGLIRGSWLGLKRILRCRPLVPGGYDPVPVKEEDQGDEKRP
jgi:uncharacterized protein